MTSRATFSRASRPTDESRDVALYHASPRDPIWEYVLWPEQAGECIARQATRVAMIGHSHVALCFRADDDGDVDATQGAQVAAGTTLDVAEGGWLLNPGSVGQPRDGDPRAAWLTLDTEAWTATYAARRIPGRQGRRVDHRGGPARAPRATPGGRAMRPRGLHRLACVLGKRATLGAMSTIACAASL